MKLVCGTNLAPEGWYCSRPVNHEGPCAAHPVKADPHAVNAAYGKTILRSQSRKASLAEAVANTTIGFVISWGATLTAMWLVGFSMTFHQLWWYTWFMTIVSVVRSYWVRRMWNAEWWKRFKKAKLA
jgi:hypothetical protein